MRRGHRSAHSVAAPLLAGALALILGLAFALKTDWSAAPAPERLSGPDASTAGGDAG